MDERTLNLIYELVEAADDAAEFLDSYADVEDDPYDSQPVPNKAMSLKGRIEDVLERLWDRLPKEPVR